MEENVTGHDDAISLLIVFLIPLNFLIYNILSYIDYKNAFLSDMVISLYVYMPVLEFMARVTENLLPRQLSLFLILIFYIILTVWMIFRVLKGRGLIGFFCTTSFYTRGTIDIVKEFVCQCAGILCGTALPAFFLSINKPAETFTASLVNGLAIDSNLGILVSYGFFMFMPLNIHIVNIPVFIMCALNKSFRKKIKQRMSHEKYQ